MSRKGKYIIEIAERHTHYTDDGKPYNLYRVKGFNSLVLDDYALQKLEKLKGGKREDKYYRAFVKACEIAAVNLLQDDEMIFFPKENVVKKLRDNYIEEILKGDI